MTETKVQKVPLKTPRLLEGYRKVILPKLMEEFKIKNLMAAPRIEKIVINMGVKEGQTDIKVLEQVQVELARITGQQPVITRAKKSISAFKLREGSPIGLKVTLRRYRMYEFMDRFFNVACPRIRDFRGFSPRSFDKGANYSVGMQEQIIFPEVDFDKVKKMQGMDITFVTTTNNVEEARRLLELLGLPFRK
ncbi:MAG: 50S ribosomal protein L5 [Omnitrophica bacterium RIFCSPLOWO2_12_FULL_44_17]|uniref:Large ribosomal subunit protein uL5 n=1 Tax=Candidatus Danuiimicrobium aquiferis TaxID=1801832 RepID=A0A1G1KZZ9_9BACT|nr:MAG: 50S ribosomal protein L5 [Omnitrophica bacterium RIFCSPHIGHO2_02_FULL_45_28]OGW91772.1 MAG: 50S ribosomal protein L5 [Omnitrophica bacterium RIFCSPHIGHO2_12_FULL_44_12]OGW98476.1 MAG: 50S ribosomal protein L5 [Omnitrophica bacterium RIFCSPLOWO2_12_FULL_44_17]OGX02923.1 MAG: 50S ribosomal protein L5 [Omnitrophica bacterium RIFCSPLOWO2_02_FULL_44_11]